MTVFKTSAKAELGGLKVNASSDDLLSTGIRKIEVKILQDDDFKHTRDKLFSFDRKIYISSL